MHKAAQNIMPHGVVVLCQALCHVVLCQVLCQALCHVVLSHIALCCFVFYRLAEAVVSLHCLALCSSYCMAQQSREWSAMVGGSSEDREGLVW